MPQLWSNKDVITATIYGIILLSFSIQLLDMAPLSVFHKIAAGLLLILACNHADAVQSQLQEAYDTRKRCLTQKQSPQSEVTELKESSQYTSHAVDMPKKSEDFDETVKHYKRSTQILRAEVKRLKQARKEDQISAEKDRHVHEQSLVNTEKRYKNVMVKLKKTEANGTAANKEIASLKTMQTRDMQKANRQQAQGAENLQALITKYENVVSQLEDSKIEVNTANNNITSLHKERNEGNKNYEGELAQTNQRLMSLQREHKEVVSTLEVTKEKLSVASQTIVKVEKELQGIEAEAHRMIASMKAQTETIEEGNVSLEAAFLETEAKNTLVTTLKRKMLIQDQLVKDLGHKNSALQHSLDLQITVTKTLESSKTLAEEVIKDSKAELENVNVKLTATASKLTDVENNEQLLQAKLDVVTAHNGQQTELNTTERSLSEKATALEARVEKQAAIIKTQHEQITKNATTIAELETAKENADNFAHLLKVNSDFVSNQLAIMTAKADELEKELTQMVYHAKGHQRVVDLLKADKDSAFEYVQTLEETAEDFRTRASNAEEALAIQIVDAEETIIAAGGVDSIKKGHDDRVENLNNEIETLKARLAMNEAKNDELVLSANLTQNVDAVGVHDSSKIDELQGQIDKLKRQVELAGEQLIESEGVSRDKQQLLQASIEKLTREKEAAVSIAELWQKDTPRFKDPGTNDDALGFKVAELEHALKDQKDRVCRLRNECSMAGADSWKFKSERDEIQRAYDSLREQHLGQERNDFGFGRDLAFGAPAHIVHRDDEPGQPDAGSVIQTYPDSVTHSRYPSSQTFVDPVDADHSRHPSENPVDAIKANFTLVDDERATSDLGFIQPSPPAIVARAGKKRPRRERTNFKMCKHDILCKFAECPFKHHSLMRTKGEVRLDEKCENSANCSMRSCLGWHPSPAARWRA